MFAFIIHVFPGNERAAKRFRLLFRTQRTAGRTVTEDLARIEREKRRLAQAGIDAFWQALAQLGYDRAQALELLQQDLRQTKEEM